MKKYPADIMVDEFNIPVMQSKVEEVLRDYGYEPSPENVNLVLKKDLLTEVCISLTNQLKEEIAAVFQQNQESGKYEGLKEIEYKN